MATTTARPIATMPAGGRLLRAVPYSSPMLKSVCSAGPLSEAGGGGVGDGVDMTTSNRKDSTRNLQCQLTVASRASSHRQTSPPAEYLVRLFQSTTPPELP